MKSVDDMTVSEIKDEFTTKVNEIIIGLDEYDKETVL